jgi:hypothetical protein
MNRERLFCTLVKDNDGETHVFHSRVDNPVDAEQLVTEALIEYGFDPETIVEFDFTNFEVDSDNTFEL